MAKELSVDLHVWLIIPDTTAITTFHTLQNMGIKISALKRKDFYSFTVEEKHAKNFAEKIKKIDVLVNANKNKCSVSVFDKDNQSNDNANKKGCYSVLVEDLDHPTKLLNTLKHRLGLNEICDMQKGVLWELQVDDEVTAKRIASELLCNEHYQKFVVRK